MQERMVALVSDDLLFASQLEAAVRRTGGTLVRVRGDQPVPDSPTVFVDLNQNSGKRLGMIALLREQRPAGAIIGFCHHAERALRVAAMDAGADQVITNGSLQSVAVRLAGGAAGG